MADRGVENKYALFMEHLLCTALNIIFFKCEFQAEGFQTIRSPIPEIRHNVYSITSLTCPWPTFEDLLKCFLWLNIQLLSGNANVIWKYKAFNFACHCTKRIWGPISLPFEANKQLWHGQMYSLEAHKSYKFNTWLSSKVLEGASLSTGKIAFYEIYMFT